jgi:hypothetical protein
MARSFHCDRKIAVSQATMNLFAQGDLHVDENRRVEQEIDNILDGVFFRLDTKPGVKTFSTFQCSSASEVRSKGLTNHPS